MSAPSHDAPAPRIARHLLWRFLPADLREPVIGDFEELYAAVATRHGRTQARFWYWAQTLRSVFACLGGVLTETLGETWTCLTAAYRTLVRERRSTLVSIAGLTMAFAVGLFVSVHIVRELGFDGYHDKADRIYRVAARLTLGGTPNAIASTNAALAAAVVDAFPEVSSATHVRPLGKRIVRHSGRHFYEERILYADPSFFDVFSFSFTKGDPAGALTRAGSVVITERMARVYFGGDDPIGQSLWIDDHDEYTVTGVIRDVRLDSHFVFDMLCSMSTLREPDPERTETFFGPFVNYTYVVLRDGGLADRVERKFAGLVTEKAGAELAAEGASVEYFLQPLTQIHLGSHLRHELAPNGRAAHFVVLALVALAMLLVASFNLVHLANQRWAARVREVGERTARVRQFVAEAMLFSLSALALALALVHVAFPWIGPWLVTDHFAFAEGIVAMSPEPDRQLDYASLPWLIPAFGVLAVSVGLAAGCYPVVFATTRRRGRSPEMRRLLLATQLAVSLVLLVSAGAVVRQAGHLEHVKLGFEKDHVIVLPVVDTDQPLGITALKARLSKVPGVVAVGAGSHVPGQRPSGGAYVPEGYPDGQTAMMDRMSVDDTFLTALGMEIVEGRGFTAADVGAATDAVLVNAAAVAAFGWQHPIGKTIRRPGDGLTKVVVGVVRDFHFSSAHRRIGPILIEYKEHGLRSLVVKVEPSSAAGAKERLRAAVAALDPERPFEAALLESSYDRQYTAERNLGRLLVLFAVSAVLITALGLFGVAPLLGANRLLARCREMLVLYVLANLVALPVAYLLLLRWLESFAYRTVPGIGVFAIATMVMLAISLVALSSPAGKAGLAAER